MAGDSVTLRLDGAVSIAAFGEATSKLARLLSELDKEAHASGQVEWVLSGLELGSALVTASPVPESEDAADLVPRLVGRFLETAREVRRNPGLLTRPTLRIVHDIATSAATDSNEVVFETADGEVVFPPATVAPNRPPEALPRAYGTVRGRVATLQQRRGLRFVLYDDLNDKAVTCYLTQGAEEQMRDAWGRLAEITGLVTRDPFTDRPLSVREVTDVRIIREPSRLGFKRARGAVPVAPGTPRAEEIIRQARDAS